MRTFIGWVASYIRVSPQANRSFWKIRQLLLDFIWSFCIIFCCFFYLHFCSTIRIFCRGSCVLITKVCFSKCRIPWILRYYNVRIRQVFVRSYPYSMECLCIHRTNSSYILEPYIRRWLGPFPTCSYKEEGRSENSCQNQCIFEIAF